MTEFRFEAHVGVTVLPFSSPICEPVRVRQAASVPMRRTGARECPLVATVAAGAGPGAAATPTRVRRMADGFYVEVLGPRLEPLDEDGFAALVARAGTLGSQGPVTWGSNPFGAPPPHGPDAVPGLAEGGGPDGRSIAGEEAARVASSLLSVDGTVHVLRSAPGWRVEDRGGTYVVRPYVPSGRPDPDPVVSGRGLASYWVDVPGDRRGVMDGLLDAGRLRVGGSPVGRVPIPEPPAVSWIGRPQSLALDAGAEVAAAIARLVRASVGLQPRNGPAAEGWAALRDELAGGGVDVPLSLELMGGMAERDRAGPNPTLGTAIWMELVRLKAMGVGS